MVTILDDFNVCYILVASIYSFIESIIFITPRLGDLQRCVTSVRRGVALLLDQGPPNVIRNFFVASAGDWDESLAGQQPR